MNFTKMRIPLDGILGGEVLITGVSPVYVYKEGVRTKEIEGTRYQGLLKDKKYEAISVKVSGKPIITAEELEKTEEMPVIMFKGLSGKIYVDKNGRAQVSITADSVEELL